jgi:sulfide:quinone oxidoreductase
VRRRVPVRSDRDGPGALLIPEQEGPFRVLIAGGGVGAVEALLALHDLAPGLVRVELLAPEDEFVHRPLLVAEPFGIGEAVQLDLARIAVEHGATHRRDALEAIDPSDRSVTTVDGEELPYDALLVTIGAKPVVAVPGALTFSGERERGAFAKLLDSLGGKGARALAFVVPPGAKWSIAAYELALLTASHLEARDVAGTEITVVTHEAEPMELFGAPGSDLIAELLIKASIRLRATSVAVSFEDGSLELADGERIPTDRAVALPTLEVPPIPGVPQRRNGFVPTDIQMHVAGLERVWAAGDVTWFPIKQGGLAAQQAEVAARSIAVSAGARLPAMPFRPVLRGTVLTGELPRFLRKTIADLGDSVTAASALWSPAVKVAGRYIGPYLATLHGGRPERSLTDLDRPLDEEKPDAEAEQRDAFGFALAAADSDARLGDFVGALEWLRLVEELNLVIPPSHARRRREWEALAAGD